MCVLCYELAPEDHWSDGLSGAAAEESRGRARQRRVRLLSRVLSVYGLSVTDPSNGPHLVVEDRKGAAEIATGLPAVWQAADRLSSGQVDVLDPALLDAITADRT